MARPAVVTALALVALAVLGGGWFVYQRAVTSDGAVPLLIRADAGPIKIRPKDPGGMAVPDQDKLIYQTLNGGLADETIERLLPPPEEPMPPPEPPQPIVKAVPKVPESTVPPLPAAEIDPPSTVAAPPSEPTPPPPPPVEQPAPKPKPAETTAPPVLPVAGAGPYMVQLASLRSIDDAEKTWRKVVKNNADLLSAHSARMVRADLGAEKGVYYRLRVGPFANRLDAKALCDKLKARKINCIVVRP